MKTVPMRIRTAVTIGATTLAAIASVAAHTPPPDGFEYVPRTEFVNLNIGCDQGDDGTTCDTTEYWLGKDVGTDNVAQLGWTTPLDWATTTANGTYRYQSFPGNSTLEPQYILNAHDDIEGQVEIGGYAGGAEVAADSGVSVVFTARDADTGQVLTLGGAEVTKPVVTPGVATPDSRVYEFTIELAEDLDGVAITSLRVDVGMKHLTLLANGFMNGQGGSFFELPHYELRALPEPPEEEAEGPER